MRGQLGDLEDLGGGEGVLLVDFLEEMIVIPEPIDFTANRKNLVSGKSQLESFLLCFVDFLTRALRFFCLNLVSLMSKMEKY